MSGESHLQRYSASGSSDGYSWSNPDIPSNDLEQLLELTGAQRHPDLQYQVSNLPEGYTHASSSCTPSDLGRDLAHDYYADQLGQPYHPSSHAQYADQPAQTHYQEAYQYAQDHADSDAPAQWPSSYEDADGNENGEKIHFTDQPRKQRKTKARVAAVLPDGQPKSKRAERRAQILHEYGTVSATDQPRGKTRMMHGVLEWFDPHQQRFYAATPLDNYRQQIINEDNACGSYDYRPDQGLHEDDVTTFPLGDTLGQQHWNLKDRKAWGEIKDHDGNQVMYLVYKPDRDIETPNPGFMMYNNVIMLDPDDHPIIDWPGIPRCFASQMEGARIEALRRIYPWLSLTHFLARMPRWVTRKTVGVQPLFGLSSLQQRLTRFREIYDCPPWKKARVPRGASLLKHTRERLAREGLQADSTAGLWPLTRREVLRRKKTYLGRCPENAGIYTLTEEEKQEKAAREAARHEQAQAKRQKTQQQLEMPGSTSGTKRKWNNATEFSPSTRPAQKQLRSASGSAVDTSQQASPMSAHSLAPFEPAGSFSNAGSNSEQEFVHCENLSQEPEQDLRCVAPQTISEQLSIKAALSYTVDDYKYYHSTEPPTTRATCSYFEQYLQIQNHHKEAWSLEDEPAPQLMYIPKCNVSFQSVPLPDVDEESMKRLLPSHEGITLTDAGASSDQHQADTHADKEASSDQTPDVFEDTDYSYFLGDGAWDGAWDGDRDGDMETSSPVRAEPDAE